MCGKCCFRIRYRYQIAIIFLLFVIPVAHAFLPVLLAESAIGGIVGRVIISRAAQVAANDAVYLSVVNGTTRAVSSSAVAKGAAIASRSSIFRNINGALTWAGIGATLGSVTPDSFAPDGVGVATSGTLRDDGKYDVTIGGKTYVSDYEPSATAPFYISTDAVAGGTGSASDTVISDELNTDYPLYGLTAPIGGQKVMGTDVQAIANRVFDYYQTNGKLYCNSTSNKSLCTYGAFEISNSVQTSSTLFTVSGSYKVSFKSESGYTADSVESWSTKVYRTSRDVTDDQFTNDGGVSSVPQTNTDPDYSDALFKQLDEQKLKLDELAKAINDLLLSASSSPDYAGVPVTSSNPVTVDEIRHVYPDVDSLKQSEWLKPAQVSTESPLNVEVPSPSSPGSADNPAQVDLGPDPGIGTPDLENTPTASDILSPITGMFDDYDTSLNLRSVQCPTYSVDLFGKSFVMDAQCTLAEENRSMIALIFMAFWGFIAFRIVMEA